MSKPPIHAGPKVGHTPQHFHSLDVLRGLGAIAVVFCHWANFFYYQGVLHDFSRFPLPSVLRPLYTEGWRAVDLFFCLSGFVFFWLYSKKIATTAIGAWQFFSLRFSRLYPLHLATLLLAAAGQYLAWRTFGAYFVSTENDAARFTVQFFFGSAWFGNWGISSYNFPAWSVSVEIFLYFCFFLVCRFRGNNWPFLLGCVAIGVIWTIHPWVYRDTARGVMSFFIGGLAFKAYEFLVHRRLSGGMVRLMIVTTALLWILIPWEVNHQNIHKCLQDLTGHGNGRLAGLTDKLAVRVIERAYELFLFPLTLCTLALWETRRGTLGKRVAFLGDISYSTYLLHFPLQTFFIVLAAWIGLDQAIFSSPWTLLVFFLVLIPLALLSYHFLERPCQSWLRKKLLPKPKS